MNENMETSKNEWWGYLHVNGSVIVKRYLDTKDITEALESPFVKYVSGVCLAVDRKEAIEIITKELE